MVIIRQIYAWLSMSYNLKNRDGLPPMAFIRKDIRLYPLCLSYFWYKTLFCDILIFGIIVVALTSMKEIILKILIEYSINAANYDVTILREDLDNMSDDIVREISRYIDKDK